MKSFLQLNLGYVALYSPHLLERFSRVAMNAEKAGECKVIDSSPVGDTVVFDLSKEPEEAIELFNSWQNSGVPKAAMKLLAKMPKGMN